jgi:hypothetical protein
MRFKTRWLLYSTLILMLLLPDASQAKAVGARATTEQTRLVIQRFVAAYNKHDRAAVLSLVTANVRYLDCDYSDRQAHDLRGKRALTGWLRARFAEHDRFQVTSILAGGWSDDAVDPRVFGIMGTRTNDAIRAQRLQPQEINGSKGILNQAGTRIRSYQVRDAAGCKVGAGKFSSGAPS